MNQNSVFQDFQSLPPEAQRQVADFIAFLQARYKPTAARRKAKQSNLSEDAFIGSSAKLTFGFLANDLIFGYI